ncbi:coiled-coil domain-containing protein 170 isoform X1 [Drosophila pseudoobscura]|uniref:Coiled-coil domain-containing protein 170 isoform X1 n=1 Tax=Drosophila pseudoobscura pseudoobscura TaxID=46245 RepID=A0A0R3NX57_DROPS|nr:coiled-coil domain-containing protein 170 isoform X1 [Drosophila pseudoobscura]
MPTNPRPTTNGNTTEDWQVFELLCGNGNGSVPGQMSTMSPPAHRTLPSYQLDTSCGSAGITVTEHHHGLDMTTTLRSELAALSYKKERLAGELAETRSALCSKEVDIENLRSQAARQTALIGSLQSRLQNAESREQAVQARCDSTINTVQREKRSSDERNKELICKIQHLETHVANEESQKEQAKAQLHDLLRRLSISLGMDVCESNQNAHATPECVVSRAEEVMVELQRAKAKISSTCDTLSSCENELLNLKSLANIEKQRLSAQLDGAGNHNHELEGRCRQYERDLQIQRDRLTESEINGEKLKEELRGFESRCHRLQNNLDRIQGDRLQFLRGLSNLLNVPEPCETLIKEKLRETLSENQAMHAQMHSLRDQLTSEHEKLKETQQSTECRLRSGEAQKCELSERLEKCHAEIHTLRKDHMGLSEFLQRLASAMNWSECSAPPALGADTNLMADNLLERAERLTAHCEHEVSHHHGHHHGHSPDKGCCGGDPHHGHGHGKLRRERSCHDIPLKESSSVYNLQRRVRVLREQVQRRDLHLELLRRKLAIIEDGARGKCMLQGERDDAVCRAKKAAKQVDKLSAQLGDARSQIAEVKAQLAEAVEYKITSLERARKIDELSTQLCDLEDEKTRLLSQLNAMKERMKAACESNQNRRCRDEALINSMRDDVNRLSSQLSDANQRLSHLQSFRTSVARTLHLRDLPETDLLHRLQALCSAHQEFTLLSKRYETASPVGEHPCPRYDDPVPPSNHCRPPRDLSSPPPYHHKTTLHPHPHASGEHHHSSSSHVHNHHGSHGSHGHRRQRSKSRDKRLHDECFDTDVHRRHHGCKDELLATGSGGSCDDDFDFKSKYC